jgi:pyruvate dehydrogenase E1 component
MTPATDDVSQHANQIRERIPTRYSVLGTDGFGRSDTRANLRRHFEVDRYYVAQAAVAALAALADKKGVRFIICLMPGMLSA